MEHQDTKVWFWKCFWKGRKQGFLHLKRLFIWKNQGFAFEKVFDMGNQRTNVSTSEKAFVGFKSKTVFN